MLVSRKSVLIVEDEALIAMMVEDQVREMGHASRTVRDIDAALLAVAAGWMDLAILDVMLRERDTRPVAEALRARQIPFIVCSGSEIAELADSFADVPFLAKPFRDQDLGAAIRTVFRS
jgi:DNA-binding response OmpR family regulator